MGHCDSINQGKIVLLRRLIKTWVLHLQLLIITTSLFSHVSMPLGSFPAAHSCFWIRLLCEAAWCSEVVGREVKDWGEGFTFQQYFLLIFFFTFWQGKITGLTSTGITAETSLPPTLPIALPVGWTAKLKRPYFKIPFAISGKTYEHNFIRVVEI